jgi:hypothetical protein
MPHRQDFCQSFSIVSIHQTCYNRNVSGHYRGEGGEDIVLLHPSLNSDTAGEVLQALVRCLGVVMVSCADVEGPHASPNANRTHPI